jgi:hypothetical protein
MSGFKGGIGTEIKVEKWGRAVKFRFSQSIIPNSKDMPPR